MKATHLTALAVITAVVSGTWWWCSAQEPATDDRLVIFASSAQAAPVHVTPEGSLFASSSVDSPVMPSSYADANTGTVEANVDVETSTDLSSKDDADTLNDAEKTTIESEEIALDDLAQSPDDHTESTTSAPSAQRNMRDAVYGYALNDIGMSIREEYIDYDTSGTNYPPQINPAVHSQLQKIVDNWAFSQDMPVRYTLPIDNLFTDPEGDPIRLRAYLSIPGVQVSPTSSTLRVQGIPQTLVAFPSLVIEAQDNQHGNQPWVSAYFTLRPMQTPADKVPHPLEGETLYRLETTYGLADTYYSYEVVYCEAWRFKDGLVYFAAANTQTHCPMNSHLQEIGEYTVDDKKDLIVTSTSSQLNGQQRWNVKWIYDSWYREGVKNFFTTVYAGKHVESYTLQRSRSAMEARLNVQTGQYPFQMQMFDYLVPLSNGQFLQSFAGNYIYLYGPHDEYQGLDSDWNLHSPLRDLACENVLPFWQSNVLAGEGETGDIISSSADPWSSAPIHCGVHYRDDWQRNYVYFGLQYHRYDYFVPGNIYSFIIRPKPEYAHIVEEFKINLRYHNPDYMKP
ncbi:hypothetical protein L4C36_19090 [Photobacterium japonica]|uniref:hypothetical protein n=1 Tax=Photobacterium japonica TaxID=2910235 RepID=UPI003D10D15C